MNKLTCAGLTFLVNNCLGNTGWNFMGKHAMDWMIIKLTSSFTNKKLKRTKSMFYWKFEINS